MQEQTLRAFKNEEIAGFHQKDRKRNIKNY